ncbi:hypothetical protein JOE31_004106 [Arthrobacter sp. PvP023]|uniref:hypothetical protein n=2 Tax=Micrococcaceae TaxID=1268 RepID=UPI001B3EB90B|nr:hypothetical protein [Arthrobacter sp. PvP023]
MKMIKTMLTATLVAGLTGCSYTGAPEDSATDSPVDPTSTSTPAPESGQPQVFEGKFVSQAAMTRGTVTLTVTPSKVELELAEFSTGDAEDLYVHLNPGTLEPSAIGELGLNTP